MQRRAGGQPSHLYDGTRAQKEGLSWSGADDGGGWATGAALEKSVLEVLLADEGERRWYARSLVTMVDEATVSAAEAKGETHI